MGSSNHFLRLGTVSGNGKVLAAAKHNLRELQSELGAESHIDASRTGLNTILAGASTAAEIASEAKRLMLEAGISKPRKNCALAIEVLVSLSSSWAPDDAAFFADSLEWASRFYRVPVLSAVIHRDEAALHMHVLLLPLVNGRMKGRDVLGNKGRIYAAQSSFYSEVGERYGLARPKPRKRISAGTGSKAASIVISAFQSDPSLIDKPEISSALHSTVAKDPIALLEALGLAIPYPPKKQETFVGIMTKPCPEKKSAIAVPNRSNAMAVSSQESGNRYPCVSGSDSDSANDAMAVPFNEHAGLPVPVVRPSEVGTELTRFRDDEHSVSHWDSDRGEYIVPDRPKRSQTILY